MWLLVFWCSSYLLSILVFNTIGYQTPASLEAVVCEQRNKVSKLTSFTWSPMLHDINSARTLSAEPSYYQSATSHFFIITPVSYFVHQNWVYWLRNRHHSVLITLQFPVTVPCVSCSQFTSNINQIIQCSKHRLTWAGFSPGSRCDSEIKYQFLKPLPEVNVLLQCKL